MNPRDWEGLPGWPGTFEPGKRPAGIHPTAEIGGPPEHPEWLVGAEIVPPLVAPSALINSFCTVDGGMVGFPPTTIGERAFLQSKVHIGHNAIVEDDARVCVGATICGHVVVGAGASVSGNAWVKPFVKIGEGAIVGGGAVVTKDVPAHEVWAGNPAKFHALAWTHPNYGKAPEKPDQEWVVPPENPHPYRDSDEVWSMMQPYHFRAGVQS